MYSAYPCKVKRPDGRIIRIRYDDNVFMKKNTLVNLVKPNLHRNDDA